MHTVSSVKTIQSIAIAHSKVADNPITSLVQIINIVNYVSICNFCRDTVSKMFCQNQPHHFTI